MNEKFWQIFEQALKNFFIFDYYDVSEQVFLTPVS